MSTCSHMVWIKKFKVIIDNDIPQEFSWGSNHSGSVPVVQWTDLSLHGESSA